MTTQPEQPSDEQPPGPFWTETPEEVFGRTVIDPLMEKAEEWSRREAEDPSMPTRLAAAALEKVETLEDKLEEKLQPLEQKLDQAVDSTLNPVFERLDRSPLVDRILTWWLNLGKPKTDERRVEVWIAEHPDDVRRLSYELQRGEKSPAWGTAFGIVLTETPRGQDVDVDRVARVENLIYQRVGQQREAH
ncbi:MAG: hypothetical protein VB036_05145 [Propionicimonas sp.]|nr:hypothetical protein [Propionicimonas sp.]